MFSKNSNKRTINDVYFGLNPVKRNRNKREKKDKKKGNDSDSDDESDKSGDLPEIKLGTKHNDEKIERDCNHVYFHSEVTRESIFDLCNLIKEAEEENILTSHKLNIEPIPIYLHINSFGGSVYAGLMAIDIIKACKVPIYSIIDSSTASCGTLISVVCEKRYIRPSAHMLIHQLSSTIIGKWFEIEDEYKHLEDLMKKINKIYIDHTSIPKKELTELLKHDLWLDAEKSIKYGLADEYWTK
jgi:ATP-dependent Clp protease protease subunit